MTKTSPDKRTSPDRRTSTYPDRPAFDFPPQSLPEYALLADGFRGALIGPGGDISWLCAPVWDSAPVFSQLIGGRGLYAISPTDDFVWGGSYEPGSLIWRSRWTTTKGTIECREALTFPGERQRVVVLRRVEAQDEAVTLDVTLDLSGAFGRAKSVTVRRDDNGVWHVRGGGMHARWSGASVAGVDADHRLWMRLELQPHARHDFVLGISDHSLGDPVEPDAAWFATERRWNDAVPTFAGSAAPRDSRHAYAVLRGLTAPGGGMVAAATLGMPERADAGRNYDYRYVWLRDQAYAGLAVGVDEPLPLLDEAVSFTTARVLADGDQIAPAYRLDGSLSPHQATIDLPGYPGGRPVSGNWVRGQFQLDSVGEMLQLYATAGRHDHLNADDHRAVTVLMDVLAKRWMEPDAGIWELETAWWTHSRLACVAGLRSAAEQIGTVDTMSALSLADAIMAETSKRSLGPGGAWRQTPDRHRVDAALLLSAVRGALSPRDPRSLATLRAVSDELVEDGYVYRYAVDGKPLGAAEGAFVMCGFAMSLAQLAAGDVVEAFRWFERQRAACGPAGLLAEEFDVRQRQLRGNLPQGFVHALLLECSLRLGHTQQGRGAA